MKDRQLGEEKEINLNQKEDKLYSRRSILKTGGLGAIGFVALNLLPKGIQNTVFANSHSTQNEASTPFVNKKILS
ncbi:hypothetical protein [Bacillus sp. 2205SS5-2]|uniref:hypothetical protein n=1 Tax=Bacillus sp. 2205SS5-2 TaxID=3109031 RepID=UPI003007AE97